MGPLLQTVVRMRGYLLSRKLDRASNRPDVAQKTFLRDLLKANAATVFGKEHGFADVRSETDYRRQIPIRDYEDFRSYVNQIIAGEKNVLTADSPCMLNLTSGTTGEPKYIPVTRTSLRQASHFSIEWIYRALKNHPTCLDHSFVGIVSRAVEGETASGIKFGSASGMLYKSIPSPIRSAYAVPYMVSEIHDYNKRYFIAARLALAKRVSYIGTPNPSTLIRLAETATRNTEAILRAIHDGTLGVDISNQLDVETCLARSLKPDPKRAKNLDKIVERRGELRLPDCWPDLCLIGCWLGGSVGTQARKLASYYGEVPMRDLGFLASEGHFTLPFQDQNPSGILSLNNNYYEFIPEKDLDSTNPIVLSSNELEEGTNYGVLLTTPGGFYRYDINDIVQVTGFFRNTPLLMFIRKGRDMTNITGEKMHVNHLLLALEKVKRLYDLSLVEQFRIVANIEWQRYEIYIELKENISHDILRDQVIPEIDLALAQVNVEYAEKRRSQRLILPCLHLMPCGWGESELKNSSHVNRKDAQYKWRILCPESRLEDSKAVLHTITCEDPHKSLLRSI